MTSTSLAERGDVVGGGKHAAGEHLAILVAGGDDVLLGRFPHRQNVLVLVDDRVADEHDPVVADRARAARTSRRGRRRRAAVEVVADVRLVNVEVPVDQLGRAEGGFVGEVDAAAVQPPPPRARTMILPVTSPSGFA